MKVDLKRYLKHLYHPSAKTISTVAVPTMNFLMIDGQGDPNTSHRYGEAIDTLFSMAYTLKFMIKKGELDIDYAVMPLEGLWWVDDMSRFTITDKSDWQWTMMIMQPDFITMEHYTAAYHQVAQKKCPPALDLLRFESFAEGTAAQTLHIGPFSEEGPTVERLHAFIEERSYRRSGKHHEIYLSDIRKARPEKWKTIIRQPINRV